MSRKAKREKSEITVMVPDLESLKESALAFINKNRKEKERDLATSASICGKFGYVKTPNGVFTLESEGIIDTDPVSDESPFVLEFYGHNETEIGIFPECAMKGSEKELLGLPVTKEFPLEDFVRAFGNSLESNYRTCLNFLREQMWEKVDETYLEEVDDECLVNSDGCLIDNDGDAETDME